MCCIACTCLPGSKAKQKEQELLNLEWEIASAIEQQSAKLAARPSVPKTTFYRYAALVWTACEEAAEEEFESVQGDLIFECFQDEINWLFLFWITINNLFCVKIYNII